MEESTDDYVLVGASRLPPGTSYQSISLFSLLSLFLVFFPRRHVALWAGAHGSRLAAGAGLLTSSWRIVHMLPAMTSKRRK